MAAPIPVDIKNDFTQHLSKHGSLLRSSFFIIYMTSLFLVQALYAYIYGQSSYLRTDYVLQIAIRLVTWTLPILIYMKLKKIDILLSLGLRRNVLHGLGVGLFISLLLTGGNLAAYYIMNGSVHIRFDLGRELWWKSIILVGFSEEVVFRGFVLQRLTEKKRFWIANLIQSALFLLIHCPGWLFLGQFVFPGILHAAAYIFAIGLFLGVVNKKSESLWPCMIIHSVNNFCSLAIS